MDTRPATYVPIPDNSATQHDGTEHLAINNKLLRRLAVLCALKLTARFFTRDPPCYRIAKNIIVKTGPKVHLTEAATMQFLASNTNVPVPRVYCSFVHKNHAYIVMRRVSGIPMSKAWRKLSESDREAVLYHLRTIVEDMRALTPPPGFHAVSSCTNGALRDSRIPKSNPRFGPFRKVQDFHQWLRDGYETAEHPDMPGNEEWTKVKQMVQAHKRDWAAPPIFTHGDLNPSNIFINQNRVTAVIDWEFSGWYPYYWEYTSAWHGNRNRVPWQEVLEKFLEPYPQELAMEITRQKYWGEL